MKQIKISMMIVLLLIISGCIEHDPKLFVMHVDNSESALNDKPFATSLFQNCDELAKRVLPGDQFVGFLVNGDKPIAKDPNLTTPKDIRTFCKNLKAEFTRSEKQGTHICPVLSSSQNAIQRSNLPPVVLSIVQTNEEEQFCGQTWINLANDIGEKDGALIIVNSTNKAGQDYNQKLSNLFKNYSNVKFCDNTKCVKNQINYVQNKNI